MRRIAVVCARGGSQGVAGKNLLEVGGRTLVRRALDHARESGLFASVALSSDDDAILAQAHGLDVEVVRRPAELATAAAAKLPVIRHCVAAAETHTGGRFDIVADIDATAPLRSVADVRGAVALLEESGAPNVVSGSRARRSPEFNLVEIDGEGRAALVRPPDAPVTRRQEAGRYFDLTPAVYVWRRDALDTCGERVIVAGTRLFEMPPERAIDIDDGVDLALVQLLAARGAS